MTGFAGCGAVSGGTSSGDKQFTVTCSVDPLAIWNPRTLSLDPPSGTTIVLQAGAHAHDPGAVRVEVAL